MDTKLKKSSKLAKLIIAMTVLIPALLLVSLYPRMEKLVVDKQKDYQEEMTNNSVVVDVGTEPPGPDNYTNYSSIAVSPNVVNYAVEAAYYLYGRLLQEARGTAVDFSVLDVHGWINDYYTVNEETFYQAQYIHEHYGRQTGNISDTQLQEMTSMAQFSFTKADMMELWEAYGIVGSLVLEFDEYGMISRIEFVGVEDVEYTENLYEKARNSVKQYQENAAYYKENHPMVALDETEIQPKNFKIALLLSLDSMFIHNYNVDFDSYVNSFLYDKESLYWEIGAPLVVLAFLIVVALVALILPFFKKLNTGWEKLFCLPLEIIFGLVIGLGLMGYGMFKTMCYTTMTDIEQSVGSIEIMGYLFQPGTLYGMILAANVLGWALCFGVEYTIVAHYRQFLCGPIYYFKNRILIVRFFGWIGRQIKRLYHFIIDVDINKGLHGTIVKIVLANFVIVSVCCCLWAFGIAGIAVYSVILYVLLRKQGEKIEKQYDSIMHATKQMAEGELKIALNKDLGVFALLGAELEKVQMGFSKAVAEEAKSQNMKTELISNVSHDLKTPLTAIITYVNLLKQDGLTEADKKSYIQTLDMKSQRLKALIEDLFEVSKAQSGNIQLNLMDVDVVNLMKQLRLEMEDKLADSDLAFRWNLPEEKVILNLDGQKTYRVFENLLTNALKYAMPGSRVYIEIINREAEAEIIFKNISAVELAPDADRLTERFVRGDSSRTTEGSGLGLAIVKSFVELQGGNFKIDIDGDLFKAVILWKK